jgi:hypothetical protein
LSLCSFSGYPCLGLQLGDAALYEDLKLADHLAPSGAASGFEARMNARRQVEAKTLSRLGGRGYTMRGTGRTRLAVMSYSIPLEGFNFLSRGLPWLRRCCERFLRHGSKFLGLST